MATAKELYEMAFSYPRDVRSDEYRQGVLGAIRYWMGEARKISNPYPLGTPQADAYFSGCDEGARIVRMHNAYEGKVVEYFDGRGGPPERMSGDEWMVRRMQENTGEARLGLDPRGA